LAIIRSNHLRRICGAFLAGAGGPFVAGLVGGGDGAGGVGAAEVGHMADHIAARGVGDGEGLAIIGIDPFACDIGFGGQERRILENRAQIGNGIKHGWPPGDGPQSRGRQ
jgi:hypothetical protein